MQPFPMCWWSLLWAALLLSEKLADWVTYCLTVFTWFSKPPYSNWAAACCMTGARLLSALWPVSRILLCPALAPGSVRISPSSFDSIYHGYPVSWGEWLLIASDDPQSHGGNVLTHYPPGTGGYYYLHHVYNKSKFCPTLLDPVSLHVPHQSLGHFTLFNAAFKRHNCPSARRALAANAHQ